MKTDTDKFVVMMDPPFGGMVEVLAHNLNTISQLWKQGRCHVHVIVVICKLSNRTLHSVFDMSVSLGQIRITKKGSWAYTNKLLVGKKESVREKSIVVHEIRMRGPKV